MKVERKAETVEELAAAFAAWRIGGMPGYGFAERFKARVREAGKALGRPYGDLWAEVHRLGYEIIDADPSVR